MSSHSANRSSRLATDPAYLAHVIASLRVATGAEPIEYMNTAPYPGPENPMSQADAPNPEPTTAAPEPRVDKPVQLDLFGALTA